MEVKSTIMLKHCFMMKYNYTVVWVYSKLQATLPVTRQLF